MTASKWPSPAAFAEPRQGLGTRCHQPWWLSPTAPASAAAPPVTAQAPPCLALRRHPALGRRWVQSRHWAGRCLQAGKGIQCYQQVAQGRSFRPCFMNSKKEGRQRQAVHGQEPAAGLCRRPGALWRGRAEMGCSWSPQRKESRVLLPQSPLLQPAVLLPGHPCTRLRWARLHVPKIRFSQGAHKDSPAHTWFVNNSAQVQVSTGEGLPQFPKHAGGRAPGSSAVQEAQQRSYRAGQATAGSAGTQQPRRSCWPARWHALNEHWGNRGQGHRFKRGHRRAEHEVSL